MNQQRNPAAKIMTPEPDVEMPFFPAMNTDNRNRITGKLYFFESEQGTFPPQTSAGQITSDPP